MNWLDPKDPCYSEIGRIYPPASFGQATKNRGQTFTCPPTLRGWRLGHHGLYDRLEMPFSGSTNKPRCLSNDYAVPSHEHRPPPRPTRTSRTALKVQPCWCSFRTLTTFGTDNLPPPFLSYFPPRTASVTRCIQHGCRGSHLFARSPSSTTTELAGRQAAYTTTRPLRSMND